MNRRHGAGKAVMGLGLAAVLVAMPGPAWADVTGEQRFKIVFRQDPSSQRQPAFSRVVATGVIDAVGTDVFQESPPDDPEGYYDRLVFPRGTLTIRSVRARENLDQDPRTCVGRFSASGPYRIIAGTGDYRGATGSGRFTLRGTLRSPRTGEGCSEEGTFKGTAKLTGDITVPDRG